MKVHLVLSFHLDRFISFGSPSLTSELTGLQLRSALSGHPTEAPISDLCLYIGPGKIDIHSVWLIAVFLTIFVLLSMHSSLV